MSLRANAGTYVLVALGLLALVLGVGSHSGSAHFGMYLPGDKVHVPNLVLPARLTGVVCGVVVLALASVRTRIGSAKARRQAVTGVCLCLTVLSLLCWSAVGASAGTDFFPLVGLLQSTVQYAIPLILGALAGCLCERSGVINIAIEGQLLVGAFAAAVAASAAGMLWLGVISGALAGGLLGLLLAVFAIRYFVDQIVLGVVLNVFASGITGYLFDRELTPHANTLNSPAIFGNIRLPIIGNIPIIGPIFFDANVLLYVTYVVIFLVQVGLFRTRWGLRVRAVGEHPVAAATVGIRVIATRYQNVVLGGMVAGLGGAYLTIGSVGGFNKDMSSGKGYIALAAMIFGRWKPLGAVGAALLFGFALALESTLSTLGSPIPSDLLLTFPYVVTIIIVAGVIGKVRPPKADGRPYLPA